MASKVLTRIRSSLDNLSSTLRRIGSYVLDNPEKVIYHSVTELAEASDSSEGSVIRFCQATGFSGFQDFKLSLAVDLAAGSAVKRAYPSPDRDFLGATGETVRQAVAAIEETALLHDPEVVDAVATRLLAAEHIDVYGVGASGIIAAYLAYKLIRLGLPAQAVIDPHLAAMGAANLGATSVAVGVSSSGSTLDTIDSLQRAKDAGAYIVAVTNRLKSPLGKLADASLLGSPPESPLTGGSTFAKISQLLVIELLTGTMLKHSGLHQQAGARTARAVVRKSV